MQILLEDYKRRLATAQEMLNELRFKDDANPDFIRIKTKISCYRSMIHELDSLIKEN